MLGYKQSQILQFLQIQGQITPTGPITFIIKLILEIMVT